ncbi:elongation factor P maturation arginine rhamnosyltransferase EarP [Achromobacter aloeverae]|uniref:Protein-arginine rhamnosyltransferase n=1 Tax=Achromobacter aloeverae TaxID=1750518 RepID=A0A4Q1HQH5_9BURK|nr:elongation factor P maturation arginine rhamnosyltransferase EarP [Achromobacter aloeverae]RXN93209.1 elongation factor P maturation arginine rhamnosyltransferase EarP [Achromobacter aloeverae]
MIADIFCKRVDNYGDIGVCWRLARQLTAEHGWRVRLWLDDLPAFCRLAPHADPGADRQTVDGVDLVAWHDTMATLPTPGDIVIEAFACDPPPAFRAAMRDRRPLWLNLEYLSAEDWVAACHGLPSLQPDGLSKYFYFPGFTPATGGLPREKGLTAARQAFQRERGAQRDFLAGLGLAAPVLAQWEAGALLTTLFCYPDAPATALPAGLAAPARSPLTSLPDGLPDARRPALLLAPEGVAPSLDDCAIAPHSGVTLARIPFLSQDDYDRLLWCADLNFVRGEDSFLRAAWAARPLVWQIYVQEENAHLVKLQAWLARYNPPVPARALIEAWNRPSVPGQESDRSDVARALAAALAPAAWDAWRARATAWDAAYADQTGLADRLVAFCAKHREKG